MKDLSSKPKLNHVVEFTLIPELGGVTKKSKVTKPLMTLSSSKMAEVLLKDARNKGYIESDGGINYPIFHIVSFKIVEDSPGESSGFFFGQSSLVR